MTGGCWGVSAWWIMFRQVRYPMVSRSVSWWRCPVSRFVRSRASFTEIMKRIASLSVSCFPVSVWKMLMTFV